MTQSDIVKAILRLGRAQEKLDALLRSDVFDDLSKHDLFWQSDHEIEMNKMDAVRMRLKHIHSYLWELNGLLLGSEDDCD